MTFRPGDDIPHVDSNVILMCPPKRDAQRILDVARRCPMRDAEKTEAQHYVCSTNARQNPPKGGEPKLPTCKPG